MKELRRRQAEATGRGVPKGSRPTGDDDPGAEDNEDDLGDAEDLDTLPHGDDQASDDELAGEDVSDDGDGSPNEPRPIPRRRPRRRRATREGSQTGDGERRPPPPRAPRTGVGGPRDGGFSIRSRLTTVVVVVVVIFVVLMLVVGIDLWTDVIWYRSVGFDQVFWTRLGTQVGLFALGLVVALAVLLLNVWPAGSVQRRKVARSVAGRSAAGSTGSTKRLPTPTRGVQSDANGTAGTARRMASRPTLPRSSCRIRCRSGG
jgi:hypothetical protein